MKNIRDDRSITAPVGILGGGIVLACGSVVYACASQAMCHEQMEKWHRKRHNRTRRVVHVGEHRRRQNSWSMGLSPPVEEGLEGCPCSPPPPYSSPVPGNYPSEPPPPYTSPTPLSEPNQEGHVHCGVAPYDSPVITSRLGQGRACSVVSTTHAVHNTTTSPRSSLTPLT